jgi:hypothetical protein
LKRKKKKQGQKQNRKSWIVPAAIVLVLIAGGLVARKMFKTNEHLKQELLVKVRPFLDQGTEIRKLDFSLSSVHLRGVKLGPKDRSFLLEIDDLEIGYSIWNILRYGFRPGKIAHEVVLIHPVLTLKRRKIASRDTVPEQSGDSFKKSVEALGSIRRFAVSKAEFRVEDNAGHSVPIANQMDGQITSQPADSAEIHLSGCLFDSKKPNLHLNGKVNLPAGVLVRLTARIDESDLPREIPFLVPDYFDVQNGHFRARADMDARHKLAGFFEIRNGTFVMKQAPLRFDGAGLTGSISDSSLIFHGVVREFNGSMLSVSGGIFDWTKPRMDVSVICPQLDLAAFFATMSPGFRSIASGHARFDLQLSGTPGNPALQGHFGSDRFQLCGISIGGLKSRIGLKDSVWVLEGGNPSESSLSVTLNGSMDLSDEKKATWFSAEMKGDWLGASPSWFRKRAEIFAGNLGCRFEGQWGNLTGKVQGNLAVTPKKGAPAVLYPDISFQTGRIGIAIRSDQAFLIEGQMLSPFSKNAQWNLSARGGQWLLSFLSEGNLNRRVLGLDIHAFMNGTPKDWTFEVNGIRPGREFTRTFQAVLSSRSRLAKRNEYDFKATYFGPRGDVLALGARLVTTPNAFLVQQGEIGSWGFIHGQVPRQSRDALKMEIKIDNLSLEKLHPVFPELMPYFGKVNGKVLFSGPRSQPVAQMEASLDRGTFHGASGFEGLLSCQWIGKVFHSGNLDIRKNNLPLLVGEFVPIHGDSVTGRIQSGNMQFAELTQAWTGKKDVLNGEGSLEFGITGSGLAPVISGHVKIRNGSFKNISFSDFSADIVDTLQNRDGLAGGTCQIYNGKLMRDDGLTLAFGGTIPHGGDRQADVFLSAKGNVLGFLPETGGLVKKATADGELFFRIGGQPGAWKPSSGWIKLENGEMELSSVVKKIDKLQGEAKLVEGGPFLQISLLTGQVGGGAFTLANKRPDDADPLVFPRLGLDLGVISVSSQGKGVPMHFPGLMESGEEGWISFGGLNKGDPFWITGPVTSPGLVGSLVLNDNRVTYPFLETGESGSGFNFLERIHWNLRVVPKKDVHYVRNIESAFGNVFLDLQMQDGNGELRFEGVISDGSFSVWGNAVSTDGTIEVMDRYFKPERITFDYPRGADPILSGRAYTTLIDSTGFQSTVWMSLVTDDKVTGKEEKGGAWEQLHFRFSTDNPNMGRTEADLLAALGFSTQDIKNRAYDAVGMQVDNYFFRPLFRPLERGMRRYLGFDMVRFSSMFGRNIIQLREAQPELLDPWWLLRSSKLTVGKYLAPGLVLTYSGEIQNQYGYWLPNNALGLRHSLSLEYSIRPDLFLEMEYFYDNRLLMERREDKRIWLKHVFPF